MANIREGGICDHFRRMFNSMCCLLALIVVDEACLFHQVSRRISQQPRCGEGLESSPALILHELCRTEQARAGKLRDFAVLEKNKCGRFPLQDVDGHMQGHGYI